MILQILSLLVTLVSALAGIAIALYSSPDFRNRAIANKESAAFKLITIIDRLLFDQTPITDSHAPPIRNDSTKRTLGDPATKRSSEWITIRVQRSGVAKAAGRSLIIIIALGSVCVVVAVLMILCLIGLRLEYSLLSGMLAAVAYFLWLTLNYHSVYWDLQGLRMDNPIYVVISKDSILLLGWWTRRELSRDTNDLRFSLYTGPFNTGLFITHRGISYPICRYPWFVANSVMARDDLESLKRLLNSTLQAHANDSTDGQEQKNGQQ